MPESPYHDRGYPSVTIQILHLLAFGVMTPRAVEIPPVVSPAMDIIRSVGEQFERLRDQP